MSPPNRPVKGTPPTKPNKSVRFDQPGLGSSHDSETVRTDPLGFDGSDTNSVSSSIATDLAQSLDGASHVITMAQVRKQAEARSRVRRCLVLLMALIPLSILLSIVLLRQTGTNDTIATASTVTSTNSSATVTLPPLPEYLKDVCQQGYDEVVQSGLPHNASSSWVNCHHECRPADCCFPKDPKGPESCVVGNEQVCQDYQEACAVLHHPK